MSLLKWIWAYLFDCVHFHTTWPHQDRLGLAYVCCLDCGREMPYSLESMQIVQQAHKRKLWNSRSAVAAPVMIACALLLTSRSAVAQNSQGQTACEAEMLGQMDAHEVFSGKAHKALADVARAYRRPMPHVYILPGSWNMAYIAGSTAVDGQRQNPDWAASDRAVRLHGSKGLSWP